MPVLPLMDLMILIAWTCLIVAAAQKLLGYAIQSRAWILGLGPYDFVALACVCLLFALALAARVWVRASEPGLIRARRKAMGPTEVLPDFPDPREQTSQERPGLVSKS